MRDYYRDYYYERVENNHYDRNNYNGYHFDSRNHYSRTYAKTKRRLRLRNTSKVLFMICVFLFIVVLTIFSGKKMTYAKNSSDNLEKRFISITICYGDTVDNIADRTMGTGYSSKTSYISEICHINKIDKYTELIPGNYLILPYYEVCTP